MSIDHQNSQLSHYLRCHLAVHQVALAAAIAPHYLYSLPQCLLQLLPWPGGLPAACLLRPAQEVEPRPLLRQRHLLDAIAIIATVIVCFPLESLHRQDADVTPLLLVRCSSRLTLALHFDLISVPSYDPTC